MAMPTASARSTATAPSSHRTRFFRILLWHLAGTRKLPGEVVKTFSTTKLIDKIGAKFGRKVWEAPVGFKYVCDRMLESDILLGGEESGGIGTKLHLPERDASVNALLSAEVMAWHRKSLGELVAMLHAEFGEHHYNRVDLSLKNGQKEKALEYFADPKLSRFLDWPIIRRENLDGVKIYLGEIGWAMVRASGTEPMLQNLFRDHAPGNHQPRPGRSIAASARSVAPASRRLFAFVNRPTGRFTLSPDSVGPKGSGALQCAMQVAARNDAAEIVATMPRKEHTMEAINLNEKFTKINDHWNPRIIGELNDTYVKAVKIQGEFHWHHHDNEDELFFIVKGRLRMKFRDREVTVHPGEFIIVPKGIEHLPIADEEVHMLLVEPENNSKHRQRAQCNAVVELETFVTHHALGQRATQQSVRTEYPPGTMPATRPKTCSGASTLSTFTTKPFAGNPLRSRHRRRRPLHRENAIHRARMN